MPLSNSRRLPPATVIKPLCTIWRICYWSVPDDQVLPVQISNHYACSDKTPPHDSRKQNGDHAITTFGVDMWKFMLEFLLFTSSRFISLARQWPWNAMQLQRLFKPISRTQCRRTKTMFEDNCFAVSRYCSKIETEESKRWNPSSMMTGNDITNTQRWIISKAPTCYINEIHKVTSYKAARQ